jgi:hypothetical protein
MVYSITILDQSNFASISHRMPSGTGIDAMLADGSTSTRKRKKWRNYQRNKNNNTIIIIILAALHLSLKVLVTVSPDYKRFIF